jgi:hypothetical protein
VLWELQPRRASDPGSGAAGAGAEDVGTRASQLFLPSRRTALA